MSKSPEIIERSQLLRLASMRSFERGEDYYAEGRVTEVVEHENTYVAKVIGTEAYRVKLWIKNDVLNYDCSCPFAKTGEFCKHCVAVGLYILDKDKSPEHEPFSLDQLQNYLKKLKKEALVKMLMDQVIENDSLRRSLMLKSAGSNQKGINMSTYKAAISNAFNVDEPYNYDYSYGDIGAIEDIVDSLKKLLADGHAKEVIELAEDALEQAETALEIVDDSDGEYYAIMEIIQEIHLEACKQAKPDPEELAERLFDLELRTVWDTFYGAAENYAEVLGEKGLAVYRKLAEKEWKKVPVIKNDDSGMKYHKYSRITHIMECLEKQSDDIEALIAIKSRNLSHAYDYLEIAKICKEAKLHDKALEWAEKGLKAFPARTDSRLREFLADEYHRLKRHDGAMSLIWLDFTDITGLEQYKSLKVHADRIDQWEQWREKALSYLREDIAANKRPGKVRTLYGYGRNTDNSELVSIFLWEGDSESALREANAGGCNNYLWLDLAKAIEELHPEESIRIYKVHIEAIVAQTKNSAYEEAVRYIVKVRKLMSKLKEKPKFEQYLNSLKTTHKRKRNFMALLDKMK